MNSLPLKEQLVEKLIVHFNKPGVKAVYLELIDNNYHITSVLDSTIQHMVENLIELEEAVTNGFNNKVKFFYREEWTQGELIIQNSTEAG